jgi:GGDEF domain-containing protein
MEERQLKNIKRYLQSEDVQERIKQYMQRGRSEATVSIGRVAQLFQLKESKLRDWETRGLLKPLRSKDISGQRQYSPIELDKLAIIKELVDEGGYAPSDIPPDIDSIWYSISRSDGQQDQTMKFSEAQVEHRREADHMPIDQRINYSYHKELFWRYYASHTLRLSLMLICDDVNFTRAGLILPLHKKDAFALIHQPEDLPEVGESLIGWLGQSLSFYTFLTPAPSFEYPRDFRILPLQVIEEGISKEDKPKDSTLLVVPRMEADARPITLSEPVVETIRRLLSPLYDEVPDWHFYLGQGMRDLLDPLINFNSGINLPDTVLTGIAERVIRLGGQDREGEYRWRFCCFLVPNNSNLPLQQRSLVVRAKTKLAPSAYKIGTTIVSPDEPIISVSLRAFQSGHIIYRHMVTEEDASIAHRELEEPIGSAIAIPVGGEDRLPVAVMYVVSAQADAFNDGDQRLLRMVGRMVEELLKVYQVRLQVTEEFTNLVTNPCVADPTFGDFASENDFIKDVEYLLSDMKILAEGKESVRKEVLADPEVLKKVEQSSEAVSFIAIDIDNQTSLTNKYGYQMTKNLSRAVGLKIQRQLNVLFTNPSDCKLYHIYADRFFLLLRGISLEKAREKAELLKQVLNGSYQVDALRTSNELPRLSESMLVPAEITVRLGIASYLYTKLEEVLQRYPVENAMASATAGITNFLDLMLNVGQDAGGNVVFSWDYKIWGMRLWSDQKVERD